MPKHHQPIYSSKCILPVKFIWIPLLLCPPGTLIYNSDSLELFHYNGTDWVSTGGGSAVISIDHSSDTLRLVLKDTILKTELKLGEWADSDSIGAAIAGIYAKQALANEDTVFITDDARIGLGMINPTQKLDVDGNIRIRQVPIAPAELDSILLVDSDGVMYKRRLESFDSMKCFHPGHQ